VAAKTVVGATDMPMIAISTIRSRTNNDLMVGYIEWIMRGIVSVFQAQPCLF
jgi:hypothetical protein